MPTERRLARIRSVAALRQSGLAVVLEDIHDPHNAEAVFRSCDAFGVAEAHLIFASEAPFNPRKVGKSTSSSANKWLDFHTHSSSAECLGGLRASGYRIVAAVADPSAEPLHRVDLTGQRLAIPHRQRAQRAFRPGAPAGRLAGDRTLGRHGAQSESVGGCRDLLV